MVVRLGNSMDISMKLLITYYTVHAWNDILGALPTHTSLYGQKGGLTSWAHPLFTLPYMVRWCYRGVWPTCQSHIWYGIKETPILHTLSYMGDGIIKGCGQLVNHTWYDIKDTPILSTLPCMVKWCYKGVWPTCQSYLWHGIKDTPPSTHTPIYSQEVWQGGVANLPITCYTMWHNESWSAVACHLCRRTLHIHYRHLIYQPAAPVHSCRPMYTATQAPSVCEAWCRPVRHWHLQDINLHMGEDKHHSQCRGPLPGGSGRYEGPRADLFYLFILSLYLGFIVHFQFV